MGGLSRARQARALGRPGFRQADPLKIPAARECRVLPESGPRGDGTERPA